MIGTNDRVQMIKIENSIINERSIRTNKCSIRPFHICIIVIYYRYDIFKIIMFFMFDIEYLIKYLH